MHQLSWFFCTWQEPEKSIPGLFGIDKQLRERREDDIACLCAHTPQRGRALKGQRSGSEPWALECGGSCWNFGHLVSDHVKKIAHNHFGRTEGCEAHQSCYFQWLICLALFNPSSLSQSAEVALSAPRCKAQPHKAGAGRGIWCTKAPPPSASRFSSRKNKSLSLKALHAHVSWGRDGSFLPALGRTIKVLWALKSLGRGLAELCSCAGIALQIRDVLCIYFSVWVRLLTANNPWLWAASACATYFCSSVPPCQELESDNWLRLVPALVAHTGIST
ncbi:uncharacterized protein LOC113950547 [Corapipo altera]|uniref:uncharacterized protein LOC113950547 n=1 Tax=Corapipo altera TaxID=415028 RepID=UPI000FD6AFAA|nr:uncharacterized protein LOC113950547 [Corapipo altera]